MNSPYLSGQRSNLLSFGYHKKTVTIILKTLCSRCWAEYSFKVKQPRYRPGVAQRVQEVKVLRFHDNGTG